jgi:hypothetical protein
MDNFLREIDMAREFIRSTWIAVILNQAGFSGAPAGAPELKFDAVEQRKKYADSVIFGESLDLPEAGFSSRMIISTEKISEDTEKGKPAWDMKPYLLNYKGDGTKARNGKHGRYNIIPFRHGTSDQSGVNAHFKTMPKDIYEAARKLAPTLSNGAKILAYGGKLLGTNWDGKYPPRKKTYFIPSGGHVLSKLASGGYGSGKEASYTHKTSIFEGMLKVQASYAKGSSSQYMTFRCVSDNSPASSWWHPGRGAQPHLQFVSDYCKPLIEKKLKAAAELDLMTFDGIGMDITRI